VVVRNRVVALRAAAALAALGCGGAAAPEEPREPSPELQDALRIGGCAPLRYQALPEGPEDDRGPGAPGPLGLELRLGQVPNLANQDDVVGALRRRVEELEPALIECVEGLERRGPIEVAMWLFRNGRAYARQISATGDGAVDRCLRKQLRTISQLPAPSGHSRIQITYTLEIDTRPGRRAGAGVAVLSASDRIGASMTVAAAVAERGEAIERCLLPGRLRRAGRFSARLRLEAGALVEAELTGPSSRVARCTSDALAGLAVPDIEIGDRFECAFAYGREEPLPGDLEVTVGAGAVSVAGEPVAAAFLGEPPPANPLYRLLLSRRFARGAVRSGPRPARMVLAGEAPAALVVAALQSLRAADFRVASVAVGAARPATLAAIPLPRLSSSAGRAIAPTIVIGRGLWVGLGRELVARELPGGAVDELGDQLDALRAHPGATHRRDLIIGIDEGATGRAIGEVIETARSRGFDVIELVAAETARARLAR
jgi:hypothetical protein